MPERDIWKRIFKRHWFIIVFTIYVALAFSYRAMPEFFPAWAEPIFTFFGPRD